MSALVNRLGARPDINCAVSHGRLVGAFSECIGRLGGLPVVVVNPRQVYDFAKATGRLAKTDALDAEVLARFDEAVRPEVRPIKDPKCKHSRPYHPPAPTGGHARRAEKSPP